MLGIIFVVHTSIGGDKLVFRYPTVSRSRVSDETLLAFKQEHPQFSSPDVMHTHHSMHNDKLNPQAPTSGEDKYYSYNMPSVLLAPILTPKTQLCDQSFQLTIDNTMFIGHPTLLSRQKSNPLTASCPDDSSASSNLSTRVPSDSNAKTNNAQNKSTNDQDEGGGGDELRVFNVLFVLSTLNKQVKEDIPVYKIMAAQVAAALKHEQLRCGYLAEQVQTMLHVREVWLTEMARAGSGAARPDHHVLTQRLIQASRLAEEIKDIFWGTSVHRAACVRVNGWVGLHLSLRNAGHHSVLPMRPYHTLLLMEQAGAEEGDVYREDVFSLHDLPADSSPTLRRFISVASPMKGFRDLQLETDISLNMLYRMAAHLVFWGKAKIINMMTRNNIYVLTPHGNLLQSSLSSPSPSLSPSSSLTDDEQALHTFQDTNASHPTRGVNFLALSKKFAQTFPDYRLAEVLAWFSTPRILGEHVSTQPAHMHRMFIEAVSWLLKHDLLCQLYTYLHLTLPIPAIHRPKLTESIENDVTSKMPSFACSPVPLTLAEQQYLIQLDDNSPVFYNFYNLCPFFRGRHHIEEIMFRSSVTRDMLTKIMKKYKSILVSVTHEGDDLNKALR